MTMPQRVYGQRPETIEALLAGDFVLMRLRVNVWGGSFECSAK
jgi:hypothetical protein